jgi:hypothetical protein
MNIISTASAKSMSLPIHTTRMWNARQANGTIQKLDGWVCFYIQPSGVLTKIVAYCISAGTKLYYDPWKAMASCGKSPRQIITRKNTPSFQQKVELMS